MHSGFARHIGAVLRYAATTSSRVMPGRSLKVMTSVIMAISVAGRQRMVRLPPVTWRQGRVGGNIAGLVDAVRPSATDLAGVAIMLVGMAVVMLAPHSAWQE